MFSVYLFVYSLITYVRAFVVYMFRADLNYMFCVCLYVGCACIFLAYIFPVFVCIFVDYIFRVDLTYICSCIFCVYFSCRFPLYLFRVRTPPVCTDQAPDLDMWRRSCEIPLPCVVRLLLLLIVRTRAFAPIFFV